MAIGRWIALGAGLVAVGGAIAYAQYRDTEEPEYNVVFKEGDFEVREYAPMIVAEVTHSGRRSNAQGASFRRLAAYIFGQDRPNGGEDIAMTAPVITERVDENEKIAMTAPVLQEETGADTWRMRFVMPSKYTMETLPTPPSDISLTQVSGRRMAAVRFSGNASDADLIVAETRLMDWIEQEDLKASGKPEYAFYDAPMIPGPMRRNEVMIELAAE